MRKGSFGTTLPAVDECHICFDMDIHVKLQPGPRCPLCGWEP